MMILYGTKADNKMYEADMKIEIQILQYELKLN